MDVYQIVTDKIISMLERGVVPWRKCWNAGSGMPRNMVSKKEYRGVNVFLLGASLYSSPYWLTYKQATDLGGHVNRGEKSSLVVFWKMLDQQNQDESDNAKTISKAPMLRYYQLFSVEQCSGITVPPDPEETINPFTAIEKCERILSGYRNRPEILYGGKTASYSPLTDRIKMPHQHTFDTSELFYQVLFHELGHSSGAKHRLARKEVTETIHFGSEPYASEELVADLCSSYLCAHAGISNETIEQSASYIDGWLSVLRKDKRMVVLAAAQAQKAADLILGRTFSEEESS